MAVRIGHASIDERRKTKGGSAGDNNGREVYIKNRYIHPKKWVVLRCKDAKKRDKIAEAMEKACKNNDIGYDQYQRDTLFNNVKDKGFDPSKTTKKVETDCSALVRVCIAYAYGKDIAGNIRTVTEPSTLVKTGEFEKLTSDKYCKSSDYLERGMILCTPVSGHTVVVLDDGPKAKATTIKPEGDRILEWQRAAIADGFAFPKYGADGSWGAECENVAEKAIVKMRISNRKNVYKFPNLTKIVQKAVGVSIDGECGPKTDKAIIEYQQKNGLKADGEVGVKTWRKILDV